MKWKVINTAAQYKKAVTRTMEIFQAKEGSREAHELELLLVLVKDYEDKHIRSEEKDIMDLITKNAVFFKNKWNEYFAK